ncbi:hypothetical protein HPB47_024805 [Ixodes persulcatus]|uniref:Uncharacterized protein n=1 Tax=Ixodes persulcatus TaxID=34615 RepID=A0AC60Q380_IXOPE|nr:hypothetical protein HPB47_024805 [Ixodes persulcatus]
MLPLDPERPVTRVRSAWPSPRTRTGTATAGTRLFLVLLCVPLAVAIAASETGKPIVHGGPVPNGTSALSADTSSERENGTVAVQPVIRLEDSVANNSTVVTTASRKAKSEAVERPSADLEAQGSVARGFILPRPKHREDLMLGDRPFVRANEPGEPMERIYMPIRLNPGERIMSPQEVADWVARGALADFESELVRAGDIVQKNQVLRPVPPPRLVRLPARPRPTVSSTFGFPRLGPHRPQPMDEQRRPFGDTVKVLEPPPRLHRPAVVVAPPDSYEEQHGDYLERGPPPGLTVPSGIGTVSQPETITRGPHLVRPVSPPLVHVDWVPRRPSSPPLVKRPPLQHRPSASQDSVSRVQVLHRGVPTATTAAPTTTTQRTSVATANKEYEYVEYEVEEEPMTTPQRPRDSPATRVIEMVLEHGGAVVTASPAPGFGTRLFHEHVENRPHSPQYVTEAGLWKDTSGTSPNGRRGNGSFVVRSPVELSYDVAASDTVMVNGGRIAPPEAAPPADDEGRNIGGGERFRLTTVNLAYILIGSCTAVSVICLAVVAASLRCRSNSHRKNLRHLARDIEARRRWHRRIHQMNQQNQPTTAKAQPSETHAPGAGAVQHSSTCSSSASCSTVRCCCGTWTLGAKNLDSRALTSSPRKGPRRLPFGAASSLHCRALGVTDDHKSCSSDDDSLDGRSWADDCSSCAPHCTCVTAAVVHDWNLAPDSLDAASRQSTAVLPQAGPTRRHKPPPPPPPPKPSKFRCPKCSLSSRNVHPSPVSANGRCCKDGSVLWSSNDERLI